MTNCPEMEYIYHEVGLEILYKGFIDGLDRRVHSYVSFCDIDKQQVIFRLYVEKKTEGTEDAEPGS